jgi:hypothetical protein
MKLIYWKILRTKIEGKGPSPSRIKEFTNIRLGFNSLEIHQCQFDSFILAQSLFWKLWKIEYQT